jgi:hypothetical protein
MSLSWNSGQVRAVLECWRRERLFRISPHASEPRRSPEETGGAEDSPGQRKRVASLDFGRGFMHLALYGLYHFAQVLNPFTLLLGTISLKPCCSPGHYVAKGLTDGMSTPGNIFGIRKACQGGFTTQYFMVRHIHMCRMVCPLQALVLHHHLFR